MNRAQKIGLFRQKIAQSENRTELFDGWMENERDLYYVIEKITHQVVDDEYYAMKVEMFKEAMERDPNFSKKDK